MQCAVYDHATIRVADRTDLSGKATADEVLRRHFLPPQETIKEVIGIRVLPTRPLFGGGIPRKLLLRVSLAKPTSAPLRF